ncbi:MAG: CPBP family intramembrane metalloprotease [Bacteroidales bacterium]|nr:CPBP family intramembrane metalloprotease [Bacteroidales bacterium]
MEKVETDKRSERVLRKIPLWKWLLILISGYVFFCLFYFISYGFLVEAMPDNIVVKPLMILAGCALTLCLYWRLSVLVEKRVTSDLIIHRLLPDIGKGVLLGFAFFVFFTLTLWILGYYHISCVEIEWSSLFLSLMGFLLVAVGEEVICRGIIYRLIENQWGSLFALAVSCFVFGFMHLWNDNASVWSSVAIALSATESALYFYSKSLWLPIGLHWGWNFVQGNVLGYPVSGVSRETSVFTPIISGPDMITGGGFGPEASIIMVIISMAVSAWLIYRGIKKGNYVYVPLELSSTPALACLKTAGERTPSAGRSGAGRLS